MKSFQKASTITPMRSGIWRVRHLMLGSSQRYTEMVSVLGRASNFDDTWLSRSESLFLQASLIRHQGCLQVPLSESQ